MPVFFCKNNSCRFITQKIKKKTHCKLAGFNFEVIHKTRGRVFKQHFQTLRGLKKRGVAEFFLTKFDVFGNLMKHSFTVFDIASQSNNNNCERKSKQKFTEFYNN